MSGYILMQIESAPMIDTADMDPELARYLNRNYWQQRADNTGSKTTASTTATSTQPSAPAAQTEPRNTYGGGKIQEVWIIYSTNWHQMDMIWSVLVNVMPWMDIFWEKINNLRSNDSMHEVSWSVFTNLSWPFPEWQILDPWKRKRLKTTFSNMIKLAQISSNG